MPRPDIRGRVMRRKLESAGTLLVATAMALAVAYHGPFAREAAPAAVTALLERSAVPSGAVSRVELRPANPDVHWDLANLDHALVDKWVARLSGDQKRNFARDLQRMDQYDDMIAQKAAARGMPRDVVYLAMIESGGLRTAKSRVAARGLWQFMGATARQYGLTVRGGVDERIDPARSTEAALSFLNDLHASLGSWYLAFAAYNTGEGRVARALRQVTGRSTGTDADFYRIASRLPSETRNYVPKLIATARIAKEPARYGFTSADLTATPVVSETAGEVVPTVPTRVAPSRHRAEARRTASARKTSTVKRQKATRKHTSSRARKHRRR